MRCNARLWPLLLTGLTMGLFWSAAASESADFPFVIPPEGPKPGTAPAELAKLEAPAGAEGFVRVNGPRFELADSGRTIRWWGVNLCFAGCFPPHEVAERMARRLATLGVNVVRFHHMDGRSYPQGIWRGPGDWRGDFAHEEFHPEALDRLDYLIGQLKRNGVYVNLNLHVSRTFNAADGFPAAGPGEDVPRLGKAISNFYPKAVREQERYARMLLRHENRYTGNPYAEEPAVAMIEVSNEDGLLGAWSRGWLDRLPEPYLDELERQWDRWLRLQYADTEELRERWSEGKREGGDRDLLSAPDIVAKAGAHGEAEVEVTEIAADSEKSARRLKVVRPSPVSWHVQQHWFPFAVHEGTAYVLRMRVRANRRETVSVSCMMNHEPWNSLGLRVDIEVSPEWRSHTFDFTATESDAPNDDGSGGARVTLGKMSREGLVVSFTRPTLRRAEIRGLQPGERLGEVEWPGRQAGRRTPPVRRDLVRFLRDTEAGYWAGMRRYLKEELGARMPVTGTAVGFTTPQIAAETADYVDSHRYWQHPHFPGERWDRNNWYVPNEAMVDHPDGSTVGQLAGRRVFGLPFTVSEYNHPAPNEYRAEGFPLIAAWGSFQDWDGVFPFNYSNGTEWETDRFHNYFDLAGDPVKMSQMPACSDLMRHLPIGPAARVQAGRIALEQRLDTLLKQDPRTVNAYAGGADDGAWRRARIGVAVEGRSVPERMGGGGRLEWHRDEDRGWVRYSGRGVAGLIGFVEGRSVAAAGIELTAGPTDPGGFSVVLLNRVEAEEGGRYLITLAGRYYNRNMGWNEEHNSVGTDWGEGPTMCEGVPLRLEIGRERADARLYPLNADGTRRLALEPAAAGGGATVFRAGPEQRTLWYELVFAD